MMISAILLFDLTKLTGDTEAKDIIKLQGEKMYFLESMLISKSNNEKQ